MAITNGYCTLPELKAALSISDTADDDALERSITTASRQIDRWCGRRFWIDPEDTDRYFTAQDWSTCIFRGDPTSVDATSVTAVAVDLAGQGTYTELPASAWAAGPKSAAAAGQPYTFVRALSGRWLPGFEDGVKVTGKFGWASAPPEVEDACLMQSSRVFKRVREAPFGTASTSVFDEGGVQIRSNLDVDVRMILAPFRKPLV
jgi:hypothetical protein